MCAWDRLREASQIGTIFCCVSDETGKQYNIMLLVGVVVVIAVLRAVAFYVIITGRALGMVFMF